MTMENRSCLGNRKVVLTVWRSTERQADEENEGQHTDKFKEDTKTRAGWFIKLTNKHGGMQAV